MIMFVKGCMCTHDIWFNTAYMKSIYISAGESKYIVQALMDGDDEMIDISCFFKKEDALYCVDNMLRNQKSVCF